MHSIVRGLGNEAEEAVVAFLRDRGYRVLARNFTCRYGEIDVVAEIDETICFIEVRMRSTLTWGDPALTVSHAKQRRVVKTALFYLMANGRDGRMIRFDVVSVVGRHPSARIEHIPNAFDAGM